MKYKSFKPYLVFLFFSLPTPHPHAKMKDICLTLFPFLFIYICKPGTVKQPKTLLLSLQFVPIISQKIEKRGTKVFNCVFFFEANPPQIFLIIYLGLGCEVHDHTGRISLWADGLPSKVA